MSEKAPVNVAELFILVLPQLGWAREIRYLQSLDVIEIWCDAVAGLARLYFWKMCRGQLRPLTRVHVCVFLQH